MIGVGMVYSQRAVLSQSRLDDFVFELVNYMRNTERGMKSNAKPLYVKIVRADEL